MTSFIVASDGLIARPLPDWTMEKLFYIERYLDIFCTGMAGKWKLAYADMLSGPGICRNTETGEERSGSALLAWNRPEFDRLFMNDLNPLVTRALMQRIGGDQPDRAKVTTMDCNVAVDAAREFLFPPGSSSRTLGLAIIDPTAFQMSFDSVAALTDGLRLDLIIIFMTGYVRRFIARPEYENPMDSFFGTSDWRKIAEQREQGQPITYRRLLDLYESQLRGLGYAYVNDDARVINSKRSTIYHMVFASRHPRGADFFEKISRRTYQGQRRLL